MTKEKKPEKDANGDADLAESLQDEARNFKQHVIDRKGNVLHSDFEDGEEEDKHVHNVTSSPPDRFPHEEEFSLWLHHHPIHESEHEWQGAKQMGFDDLHTPSDSEFDEEPSDEEPQADNREQGAPEPAPAGGGQEGAGAPEVDSESNPEDYIHDWGSGAGVRRAPFRGGAEQGAQEEEKPR